jgi:hypothetical protein
MSIFSGNDKEIDFEEEDTLKQQVIEEFPNEKICANPDCGHIREMHVDYENECCECNCDYFEEE